MFEAPCSLPSKITMRGRRQYQRTSPNELSTSINNEVMDEKIRHVFFTIDTVINCMNQVCQISKPHGSLCAIPRIGTLDFRSYSLWFPW